MLKLCRVSRALRAGIGSPRAGGPDAGAAPVWRDRTGRSVTPLVKIGPSTIGRRPEADRAKLGHPRHCFHLQWKQCRGRCGQWNQIILAP